MTTYIELDWEEQFEPLYGSPILLQPNTLLWRGYDTRYNAIPDRFSYYSSYTVANGYAKKPNRELGCFVTTRPLKIMDIRFMKAILRRLIQMNTADPHINEFASTVLSFGICSLGHQITLVKERYKALLKGTSANADQIQSGLDAMIQTHQPNRIIEQEGIRIAETTNDGITMAFLQELFKGVFDGFLSPRLQSPFHTEKKGQLNPELILFNPKDSGLIQITRYPSHIQIHSIASYMKDKHELIDLRIAKKRGANIQTRFYLGGHSTAKKRAARGASVEHSLDKFEDKLNTNDDYTVKSYAAAIQAGKRWNSYMTILNPNTCAPSVTVTPFSTVFDRT
jgi:hypothetical protein